MRVARLGTAFLEAGGEKGKAPAWHNWFIMNNLPRRRTDDGLMTECTRRANAFEGSDVGRCRWGASDGTWRTAAAGAGEHRTGLFGRLSACFGITASAADRPSGGGAGGGARAGPGMGYEDLNEPVAPEAWSLRQTGRGRAGWGGYEVVDT